MADGGRALTYCAHGIPSTHACTSCLARERILAMREQSVSLSGGVAWSSAPALRDLALLVSLDGEGCRGIQITHGKYGYTIAYGGAMCTADTLEDAARRLLAAHEDRLHQARTVSQ